MVRMRLFLIRHGQTTCNLSEIWHGWDDCELTEAGRAQAEAVAERLAREPIAAVYCSDLRRAIQTAEAVARRHGLTPRTDLAFRERSAGQFEGMREADVVRVRPHVWEERAADFWAWSPPGGETFRELLARTMAGVERIRRSHPDETVVLVGHMGTVRALASHLGGIPMEKTYEMEFPSTGVSTFDFDQESVRMSGLNDAAHVA
jgi:broad specificity phosphatase PhoE